MRVARLAPAPALDSKVKRSPRVAPKGTPLSAGSASHPTRRQSVVRGVEAIQAIHEKVLLNAAASNSKAAESKCFSIEDDLEEVTRPVNAKLQLRAYQRVKRDTLPPSQLILKDCNRGGNDGGNLFEIDSDTDSGAGGDGISEWSGYEEDCQELRQTAEDNELEEVKKHTAPARGDNRKHSLLDVEGGGSDCQASLSTFPSLLLSENYSDGDFPSSLSMGSSASATVSRDKMIRPPSGTGHL